MGGKNKALMASGLKSILPESVLEQIYVATPKGAVKKKPNSRFNYVSGEYIKSRLNCIFGNAWSFKVDTYKELGREVLVFGTLTVPMGGGLFISKSDVGGQSVQFYKDKAQTPENVIFDGFTNAYKSALTDCIKRCAFQLGIAWDVRQPEDFQMGIMDILGDVDEVVKKIKGFGSVEELEDFKGGELKVLYGKLANVLEKNKVMSAYKAHEEYLQSNKKDNGK